MKPGLKSIAARAAACRECEPQLPLGPRPVFQVGPNARILIAGQAPGLKVHQSGIPFDDPSGDRLRSWMGIDRQTFYDSSRIAILPMGFCYPGRGKSGDLPPRKECAPLWRQQFLDAMPDIRLTLIVGQYAQAWHLEGKSSTTLTERVRQWRSYGADSMPLPHPSPRNNIWMKKNPWFEQELLPVLARRVKKALGKS